MKVNDQVNNIYEADQYCTYFKMHVKPAKLKESAKEVRVHFGTPIFNFVKILDYFNDEGLIFSLELQDTAKTMPIWLRFEQQAKTLTISGKSTDPADIKEWKLNFKGSDGFVEADVKVKFSLWITNVAPVIKEKQPDLIWYLTKKITYPIPVAERFQDDDIENNLGDILTYSVQELSLIHI